MSEWKELPPMRPAGYLCRVFQKEVDDGHLTVFVGKEGKVGWHLSMSHRSSILRGLNGKPLPGRMPTWDEIKEARYKFCPDDKYMAIIFPPKDEHVNIHPTTIHLYEMLDEKEKS